MEDQVSSIPLISTEALKIAHEFPCRLLDVNPGKASREWAMTANGDVSSVMVSTAEIVG
jgi:hypothetical protein